MTRRLAIHEAGHVVVAAHEPEWSVLAASIEEGREWTRLEHPLLGDRPSWTLLNAFGRVHAGGIAAERLAGFTCEIEPVTPLPNIFQRLDDGEMIQDDVALYSLAEWHPLRTSQVPLWIMGAEMVLRRHWPEVKTVAERLLRYEHLTFSST